MAKRKGHRIVGGLAMETEELEGRGRKKLERKGCDLVVANDPTQPGAGFEVPTNDVVLVGPEGTIGRTGVKSKREVAEAILDAVETLPRFQTLRERTKHRAEDDG
jgi:phosphopantothenoylcysteine decarboxylase/phosphopantothenate--cysteine ligase